MVAGMVINSVEGLEIAILNPHLVEVRYGRKPWQERFAVEGPFSGPATQDLVSDLVAMRHEFGDQDLAHALWSTGKIYGV